jgi:hypothetical protein
MTFDERPIHPLAGKQGIDVWVIALRGGLIKAEVFPVADPWHELNPEQKGESISRSALGLSIPMYDIGLDIGSVLDQTIQDVDGFPDTARNEVREQRDIGIADMVVGNSTIASITDMVFR